MQELKAKPRTELGKKVKVLRRAGFLPAVVYGEGIKSQSISVPHKDFERIYREAGESTLIKLKIQNPNSRKTDELDVLIYDITRDPLKGTPLHTDFHAVRMDKAIRAKIPIEFFGESPAVKNDGGVLIKVMHEVEVEALPQDLPHGLRLDLSQLTTFESKLFIKDILPPKGVKILADFGDIVALIEPPRSEEELAALQEAPPTAEAASVEVKTEQEIKRAEKEEKGKTEEAGG